MTRRSTTRTAAAVVATLLGAGLLGGCGGDSPYCAAVKENQSALDSFGTKVSDKTFAREARAVRAIAATDPAKVGDDWTAIDKAMRRVLSAQKKTGMTFADLNDPEQRADADSDDLETVTKAYGVFNDTAQQRKAVVEDVETTCDVTLK
ncbi:hypothetical protein IFT73_04910 [Aeromicrobium sp. CFBP 8757]|uniref:hypothetical protein n=1 Tax=Aeromicrobium sp. CFBP 8757 TaxID=2775288 RepID=UPI00177C2733|nr:hypothetical protein [Aeromicrobium sp. CFBP 8757]MBD8606184.1 hypothetical protein [Aeromicrobium sp. CFBP 8757]